MKERKIIIITIVTALLIAGIFIAVFIFLNNNVPTDSSNENSNSSNNSSSEEIQPENDNASSEQTEVDDAITKTIESDTKMGEALSSDPIWKYLENQYETDSYYISLVTNSDYTPVIVIMIKSSEPTTAQGRATTKQYENAALQQIRDWGFDPNNYNIQVKYRY